MKVRTALVPLACCIALIAGCGDSTGPSVGPPATIRVVSGDNQFAPAGTVLSQPIRLRVEDAQGRAIPDVVLTFSVTSGTGQLAAATATTGPDGEVDVPAWTLGKYDLPQRVTVSVGPAGSSSVSLEVTARVATQYKVDLVFPGPPMSAAQRTAFERAAARVQAMITGDVFDVLPVNPLPVDECAEDVAAFFGARHDGLIDDLVIYAVIDSIDGPGKIFAFAGPCYARLDSPIVEAPLLGIMVFDSADVRGASPEGLENVILHEMLHVAGFSSFFWNRRNLVANVGTPAWSFTGAHARQQCAAVGGTGVICTPDVPIEAQGGPGTRASHWRECELPTLGRELMTGFINTANDPLSAITVGSFGDLGYQVNLAAADSFEIPQQVPQPSTFEGCFPPSSQPGDVATSWEQVITPIAGIDRSGRVTRLQEVP